MSWATIKEAVRTAIAAAAGVIDTTGADDGATTQHTAWANQRQANRFLAEAAPRWIDLTASGVRGVGQDEVRYDVVEGLTPDLTTVTPSYCGYRVFNVTVHVGGASQDDTEDAFYLAGRIRTRIRRADVLAVLQAAGVALVDVGPSLEVDYRDINGRMQSAAFVELRFAFTEYDTDTVDASGHVASTSDAVGTLTEGFDGDDILIDANVVSP